MPGGDGAEVIYPLRSSDVLPNLILNEMSKEGQNIRKSYQRRLPSNPSKDYYFMQRNTGNTESLTVEYGFLDSSKDDVSQLKNNYRNLAEAVVRAVTKYIGADYSMSAPENADVYQVVKGDTLYSIARRFGLTVDVLKSLNNLTSDSLSIGQILILQPTNDTNNIYEVQRGDTLYSIARKFGIPVNDLISYNNLSSNIISIGQILNIPFNENIYVVKSGDTLYSIAKNNGVTVDEIKRKNNLSSNIISIGQELII